MYSFVKYLKRSARDNDVKIFNQWSRCEIETKECINEFRKNNNIDERLIILENEFTSWLHSLGYYRGVKDE